jgi:undecaprenyl-diphosphatase
VTGDDFWIGLSSLPVRLALLAAGAAIVCLAVRSIRPALAAGIAVLVTHGLTVALKELVDRPRPSGTEPPIPMPDSPSFPSGHASTAFAAAAALAVFAPRWAAAAFLSVAALVGISRLELGVHYVTDVAAGAVLGAAVGLAAGLALRGQPVAGRLDGFGERPDVVAAGPPAHDARSDREAVRE